MHNAPVRFHLPLSFVSLVAVALPLSVGALGCNSAKLMNAVADAGCADPILEYPCKLQPVGTPGCPPDLGSTAAFDRDVVLDGSAPATCTVIVNDLVPDEDNQCTIDGTCLCGVNDAGVYSWACKQ